MTQRPNILLIMTDQERYPPLYETEAITRFRRDHLEAHERIRNRGLNLHRHYTASAACVPSRTSLFTGHYPTLHGDSDTDGLAKSATDPSMFWLDPDTVPTMGSWFRAAGYRTFYRGKWHISHADITPPGSHTGLATNDVDGAVLADAVDAYRRADRLEPYGFSGWIGREPHGPEPADTGAIRDELFADQVTSLFAQLDQTDDDTPWLTVASLVNPHDITFSGPGAQFMGLPEPGEHVPGGPPPPSQADSLDDRPLCHAQFRDVWPQIIYPQPTDEEYRRLYHWLIELADRAIVRILDALEASRFAEETVVVFTSDHGEMLGAHGGLQQKWHNAFDETIRVPFMVYGPGIETGDLDLPTSHIDVLPTLLGLAGADVHRIATDLGRHHIETHELVGRDLSGVLLGQHPAHAGAEPIYFMTEDDITSGARTTGRLTGEPFDPVKAPSHVESVVAELDTEGGAGLWKLNHYYDDDPAADDPPEGVVWELHNLTTDPDERQNLAGTGLPEEQSMRAALDDQRIAKRRTPRHLQRGSG